MFFFVVAVVVSIEHWNVRNLKRHSRFTTSEYDTIDKSISDRARLILNAAPNQIRMEIVRYAVRENGLLNERK